MKTDDERRLLVLAKSYREYSRFCDDHDLNPRGRNVKWIDSPDNLRGYRDDWLVVLDWPSDRLYVQHLIDVGQLIFVELPPAAPFRVPRLELPEIRARRGGIRFPWSEEGNA